MKEKGGAICDIERNWKQLNILQKQKMYRRGLKIDFNGKMIFLFVGNHKFVIVYIVIRYWIVTTQQLLAKWLGFFFNKY